METGRKILEDVQAELPTLDEDKNICVALSGGLDSTTLVYLLTKTYGNDRVKTISFDFGQRHNIELEMASKTAKLLNVEHNIVKLDYLKDIAKKTSSLIEGSDLKPKTAEEVSGQATVDTYVPFRNLQFAAITAAYAETKNCQFIAQGLQAADSYGYWDTTLEFTEGLNNILALNRENEIKFIAPFIEMYKDEELLLAKELEKDGEFLCNTWSCYNGKTIEHNYKECGKCATCNEKLVSYVKADFTDNEITEKFNINEEEIALIRNNI